MLNELVRFNPRGQVANYVLIEVRAGRTEDRGEADEQRAKGEAPNRSCSYTVKADLQGISVQAQEPPPGLTVNNHPRAGIPGIENLWGKVDADQSQGSITIDTRNVAVTIAWRVRRSAPDLRFARRARGNWTVADAPAPGEPHKAFTVRVRNRCA